ncbi:41656_t:CDS:2, partial [Gigaspora margarita]
EALNIKIALRFEQMDSAEKSTSRTKSHLARWTSTCQKIFSITNLNSKNIHYAAGNFHFYICNEKIYIAEILAMFKKYSTSYHQVESLDGLNANHLLKIQYEAEEYSFCFIRSLGKVKVKSKTTSFFFAQYVTLLAIQLQLYKKSIEEIIQIESGVIDAKTLMKKI